MSYTTASTSRRRRPAGSGADVGGLVAFLVVAALVAGIGAGASVAGVDGWYARAPHVTWTPPGWAFGAVWSVLYTLIAVAGWLVWRRRLDTPVRMPLVAYVVQFVLNSIWAPLFFDGHAVLGSVALWIGVVVIIALDLVVAATIALFWPVSRLAAVLLLPYLVWILYASTLNWGDAILAAR